MKKTRYSTKYARLLRELRKARKDADLTQTEVAAHFGAHAPFVSKIESGERRIDVVELAEFCRIYGMKLAALLEKAQIQ